MSDLQDAIDRYDDPSPRALEWEDVMVLAEAARRVANLDLEAAWLHYYGGQLKPEGDAYQHFCNAVNIALGITEDE